MRWKTKVTKQAAYSEQAIRGLQEMMNFWNNEQKGLSTFMLYLDNPPSGLKLSKEEEKVIWQFYNFVLTASFDLPEVDKLKKIGCGYLIGYMGQFLLRKNFNQLNESVRDNGIFSVSQLPEIYRSLITLYNAVLADIQSRTVRSYPTEELIESSVKKLEADLPLITTLSQSSDVKQYVEERYSRMIKPALAF